ncbi:AIR synthase (plasmid) [Humibacter sp. BT305]|nr:AIR synthase [Humibacter sp. BT305]
MAESLSFDVPVLTGAQRPERLESAPREWIVRRADERELAAYLALRRDVFVAEQGLFAASDRDEHDDDPRTIVLVAATVSGDVVGGVRLAPASVDGRDLGWWTGSRLVVAPRARHAGGLGPELVRAACATAATLGVLRFEATVQIANRRMFERLGWVGWGELEIGGMPHVKMRWPITRFAALIQATKSPLGDLLRELHGDHPAGLGGPGFIGDDGAPVPGSDLVAANDAILPALIERDPEWAGWCGILVNLNDLSAMGAAPVGVLDAVGAATPSTARRIVNGLRSGAQAWGVPVLGGHTQLGVPPSLSVTALGRTSSPVPAGGGRPGDELTVTVDLHGGWRRGFEGRQWDSTSSRSGEELRHLGGLVRAAAPAAAKDVSIAGLVGTTAMLAEASGTGAVIDLARVPAPDGAGSADWLSCFPGFGMVTADRPMLSRMRSPLAASRGCGRLTAAPGVRLRWPDGVETDAVDASATGLGPATGADHSPAAP